MVSPPPQKNKTKQKQTNKKASIVFGKKHITAGWQNLKDYISNLFLVSVGKLASDWPLRDRWPMNVLHSDQGLFWPKLVVVITFLGNLTSGSLFRDHWPHKCSAFLLRVLWTKFDSQRIPVIESYPFCILVHLHVPDKLTSNWPLHDLLPHKYITLWSSISMTKFTLLT